MRLDMISPTVPDAQGTASGRELLAWVEAARALGHEVRCWIWDVGMMAGRDIDIPSWCRVELLPERARSGWREHLYSLRRPRWQVAEAGWRPEPGWVPYADHPTSYPAVAGCTQAVTTFHYRALLDARAVGRYRPALVQDVRAELRAARGSAVSLCWSARVARGLGRRATAVPVAYAAPAQPQELTDEPVAAVLADWNWPPNQVAAKLLLDAWPQVREEVPAARLLMAGRSQERLGIGTVPGVTLLGEVPDSAEVLARASVLAFPCPSSSGTKIKVLEALARGLPVVTTRYGVEGLRIGEGDVALAAPADYARVLARVLAAPDKRAAMGAAGRRSVLEHHSPEASARARMAAIARGLGLPEEVPSPARSSGTGAAVGGTVAAGPGASEPAQ